MAPLNAMAPLDALFFFLTFLGRSVKTEVIKRERVYQLKMGEGMSRMLRVGGGGVPWACRSISRKNGI